MLPRARMGRRQPHFSSGKGMVWPHFLLSALPVALMKGAISSQISLPALQGPPGDSTTIISSAEAL